MWKKWRGLNTSRMHCICTGVAGPKMKSRADKPCQYILQPPASRVSTLLYSGLPTYSNDYLHISKSIILIHLLIIFHPSTRYSPDTNLGLLPKPADRSSYRVGCQRRDPVVCSKCSIAILAGNVFLPCLQACQLWLTCHIKKCSQNNSKVSKFTYISVCMFHCRVRNYSSVRKTPIWLDRVVEKLQQNLYQTVQNVVSVLLISSPTVPHLTGWDCTTAVSNVKTQG